MRENPYAEVLEEIETGLWEQDLRVDEGIAEPYPYTNKTFRACIKIFMAGIMWKLWESMEGKDINEKAGHAEAMGNELRSLILKHTGVDTHKLYDA